MAASTLDMVRQAFKRRNMAQLSTASWKGYANIILDSTKYVGDGIEGLNRDQNRLGMVERADQGEFESVFFAHETDMPRGDTFSRTLKDYDQIELHSHIISEFSTLGPYFVIHICSSGF
jgi:hypothetical protein